MKQIAIVGSTASGKSDLAIRLAKQIDAYVLSLDSLSIYKEIDIASAKPTQSERADIKHYGVDLLYPDQGFDAVLFTKLYQECYEDAKKDNKNIIIVGGTSFYLKVLIDGISQLPKIDTATKAQTANSLKDLAQSYKMLQQIDPKYMSHIKPNDKYRIEKALDIYYQTSTAPSEYFTKHPPAPIIKEPLDIFEISIDRQKLRDRIFGRTKNMIDNGLIDEVAMLERKYTRSPNSMKAIGIAETLDYLDGIYSLDGLIEKISINTARLAKRQATFNNTQFENIVKKGVSDIESEVLSMF